MNKESENNEYLSPAPFRKKEDDDGIFMGAIVSPYSVIYTEAQEKGEKDIDTIIAQKKVKLESEKIPMEICRQRAIGMIPYIKNNKF